MIRSKVYKSIRDRLKEKMQALVYVDLQKGQLSKKQQNYPVPLPACLVELNSANWTNTTGGQLGEPKISLYLYLDLVTDSFDGSELENETIEILDAQDELYEIMQGFSGEDFSPLSRTSDMIYEYGERYVCYRMDFQTTLFHDDEPPKMTGLPKPVLTVKN